VCLARIRLISTKIKLPHGLAQIVVWMERKMQSKSFLCGAAAVALLVGSFAINPTAAMPPSAAFAQGDGGSQLIYKAQSRRERERQREWARCAEGRISATGSQRLSVLGARRSAARAWQDRVRSKLGEKFMDLENARDLRYECTQSARALGMKLRRCELYAIPCEPKPK
jgi:hypothetical protein